jgi:hypothetical protein
MDGCWNLNAAFLLPGASVRWVREDATNFSIDACSEIKVKKLQNQVLMIQQL